MFGQRERVILFGMIDGNEKLEDLWNIVLSVT